MIFGLIVGGVSLALAAVQLLAAAGRVQVCGPPFARQEASNATKIAYGVWIGLVGIVILVTSSLLL